MKYKGHQLKGCATEVIVLPRQSGDIVITVQAILDYDDFDKLAPRPEPPKKLLPGGITQMNVEDPEYRTALMKHVTYRTHWMILKSLQATPDLEFENVKMDDPDTWENYLEEFKTAGFAPVEVNKIIEAIMTVNGLNDKKIEEATKSFLAGQAAKLEKP